LDLNGYKVVPALRDLVKITKILRSSHRLIDRLYLRYNRAILEAL
ncbi:17548_t:CDS:2, partial [Acaulospora colombiana]